MAIGLKAGTVRGFSKDADVHAKITAAVGIDGFRFNTKEDSQEFASVAAKITFQTADGFELVQTYKLGSPEFFALASNGDQLVSAKPDVKPDSELQISPKSDFGQFLKYLEKAGVPDSKIGDKFSNLVGISGTVRSVVTGSYKKGGVDTDLHTAVFTSVDPASLGAAKASTTTNTQAAAANATTAAQPATEEVGKYAAEVLKTLVAPDTTFKTGTGFKDLKVNALKNFTKVKVPANIRTAVMTTLVSPDFINGLDGFQYENESITRVSL